MSNPGPSPATVRVTTFGTKRVLARQVFDLGATREAYRMVPATEPGSSTEVEFFGGWVAATAVIESAGAHADVAAERCVPGLRSAWLLPDATTAIGETATLVVMNPFAADAEFDVILRTNVRRIAPGDLSPVVLAPGTSVALRVNAWALEAADEDTVTAQVVPRIGRVVAGSVVVSPKGVREEAGIPAPQTRWFVPAAGYAGADLLPVLDRGPSNALVSVVAQGPTGQQLVSGLTSVEIPPDTARTFDVSALPGSAAVIQATNGAPIAAAFRIAGPRGGEATVVGVPKAAQAWIVPPALPLQGGVSTLGGWTQP